VSNYKETGPASDEGSGSDFTVETSLDVNQRIGLYQDTQIPIIVYTLDKEWQYLGSQFIIKGRYTFRL